jgi:CO/xanthine dehydrogenase Mo-binding subunit
MKHLSVIDRDTGRGKTGPYWTVGAQAVEIEYDGREHSFRLIRAVSVIDAGKAIDSSCAAGQVLGGMNMGLSNATREEYRYARNGELQNTSFRTYRVMHYAENPQYTVEFIETPNLSGPYGERGLAEHGLLGMAPALANALSRAAGIELDSLPITFETLWSAVKAKRKA